MKFNFVNLISDMWAFLGETYIPQILTLTKFPNAKPKEKFTWNTNYFVRYSFANLFCPLCGSIWRSSALPQSPNGSSCHQAAAGSHNSISTNTTKDNFLFGMRFGRVEGFPINRSLRLSWRLLSDDDLSRSGVEALFEIHFHNCCLKAYSSNFQGKEKNLFTWC